MKKKLFIAMPAYDGRLMASTFISAMTFLRDGAPELDEPPHFSILYGESHVDRVRNRLAKQFLDTSCTHMIFIDSDIVFQPQDIKAILARDEEVIGGIYAKKEPGAAKWVLNIIPGIEGPDATGKMEVRYIGTGFMLIARTVFERMIKELADIDYQDDSGQNMGTMWAFFDGGIRKKRFLSEDYAFADNWRNMGGKIYADTKVQLGHTGQINFPVPIQDKPENFGSGL